MVLSDFCGDTLDIETIFNPNYRYFGVRVFTHDLYDYCVCIVYAEEIYSSLKTALYTSSNIDQELETERSMLEKNIKENHNYRFSEHYARDHPNVRFDVYESNNLKTKRKCRLTNFDDGDSRTFTVLRRDSLEREPSYKNHDDPDYLYVDRDNERLSRITALDKLFKKEFKLEKGEAIVRQTVTDYDKEVYTKHNRQHRISQPNEFLHAEPHLRNTRTWKEENSRLYYGDLNDVSQFEIDIVDKYNRTPVSRHYKAPDRHIHDSRLQSNETTPVFNYTETRVDDDLNGTFRAKPTSSTYETYRREPERQNVELSFRERKSFAPMDDIRNTAIVNEIRNSKRFSNISAVPNNRDTTASFRQKLESYRMVDKDDRVSYTPKQSRTSVVAAYNSGNRLSKVPFDIKETPSKKSNANRSTRMSTTTKLRKSKVNPAYRPSVDDFDSEVSW